MDGGGYYVVIMSHAYIGYPSFCTNTELIAMKSGEVISTTNR